VIEFKSHRTKSLRDAESGASLVEATISTIILFMFLFGILEVSIGLYYDHVISDAAREGTRYAAVRGSDWGSTTCDGTGSASAGYLNAACVASEADIQDYVQNLGFVNPNSLTVTVQCATSISGTFSTYSSSCNASGDVVQVKVSAPFSFGLPSLKGNHWYTYNLSSTSETIIAQ
jgi:Flp pilus assembly protein TadG